MLSRIEAGTDTPTVATLVAIATALGMEPSIKLFPATGPRVHDRVSAPITDALLGVAHPRWSRRLEVAVTRPDRGVIDVVLTDADAGDVVATEIQGQLRRVEQQLRWAGQKADSLPSASGWPWGVRRPTIARLLVLRSTAETRALVRSLPELFRAAYPVSEEDAWRALTSAGGRWPGNAMLWAEATGRSARILDGPPRASGR
ncbi:MAG TPA: helix-turn-helix transcriptional regulator [Candidatus Limnocylindrales bacterium]